MKKYFLLFAFILMSCSQSSPSFADVTVTKKDSVSVLVADDVAGFTKKYTIAQLKASKETNSKTIETAQIIIERNLKANEASQSTIEATTNNNDKIDFILSQATKLGIKDSQ